MPNTTARSYEGMPPIEELAARTTDEAFDRNYKFWKPVHDRQYRLYESVRNFDRKKKRQKTSSTNRKGLITTRDSNRANIQIGLMWSLHNTAVSIAKKSIIEGEELVELQPRRGYKAYKINPTMDNSQMLKPPGERDLLYLEEMSDYIEDLFTDDRPKIKESARKGLWDIFCSGCTVLIPGWKPIIKRIRLQNGEDYEEVEADLGSFPVFDHYNSWDTFPTEKITEAEEAHEWIISAKKTIAELREWEKQGLIKNLDQVIEQLKQDSRLSSNTKSGRRMRSGDNQSDTDDSNQIEILINYTLFPLYKYQDYIDNEGKDRSKDEVECLIIKAKHADPIMLVDRNPFACQEKPVILAGWYKIPGELYPISAFEIAEKLIQHHEDMYNLIQDGANDQTYPKELMPKEGVDEAEGQAGPGYRYHVDNDNFRDGAIPQYVKPVASVLEQMYGQRDFSYQMIQTVTTINDYVQGMMPSKQVKATEVAELSQRVQTLFHQAAIDVEASLMLHIWEWIVILMAEFSDDKQIAEEMELEPVVNPVTGVVEIPNPFKQFTPVMPNPKFRVKMNGSLRAAESQANQILLTNMIALGQNIPPMPHDDGKIYVPNINKMYFDLMKISALRDTDKYKLEVPAPAPEENPEDINAIPGTANIPAA